MNTNLKGAHLGVQSRSLQKLIYSLSQNTLNRGVIRLALNQNAPASAFLAW